ncbi:hypothetical protein Glove_428g94 [Diversispora epigaea]|uniref:Uncharacterized protein n=1 Tax=Diversispora epigaea TaxID=1348612 RepID=A0A397GUQ6_9GLOM|nr:hypothetical protein Glove_428g94 [Diversispora epigaea]
MSTRRLGIVGVTERILGTQEDAWNNPAFGLEFAESQNKGTYVTNVIVSMIHASLKNLPCGGSSFISTSERQSTASTDRKGMGHMGRWPDIIFVINFQERVYELMYSVSVYSVQNEKKLMTNSESLQTEIDGLDSKLMDEITELKELKQDIDELKKELESKKNRKFQEKCILITQILFGEEPIIEYRPSFLNGLELDAFFQKYQIALEVQGLNIGSIALDVRML